MSTHKRKIKYSPDSHEHLIKIKKRCKPCWLLLLLLLLPLILLIPLEKDVKFKVLNSYDKSVVSNLNVSFEYLKRDFYNFKTNKFITPEYRYRKTAYNSDTTDEKGFAIIKKIEYTVYHWIFRNNDTTRTYATSNCYKLDTIIDLFELEDGDTLYTNPILLDFEFTVVDADDNNEPLGGALVTIKSDMFGLKDSTRSVSAGKVLFKQFPKCSNIEVVGSKYGWFNDTIKGNAGNIYQKDDTLFLKQEKTIVKFFVQDLYTKKPLVKAYGQLFFRDKPNEQVGDAFTNINGVAKGVIDDIHIVKYIRIDVNKTNKLIFYNDTSTVDYLNWIKVEDWNKRTDSAKVIFLRPNPKPILFQDINCKTKAGISGVENLVTIVKSNGEIVGPTPITSDSDGNFSISAGPGDNITIEAKINSACPNEYLPNSTTIVNAPFEDLKNDASKRKILLCKVDAKKLEFKNTDAGTGSPLSGVTNTVNVQGGGTYTYTSIADGTFVVTDVYECQIISITASKSGYETNNTTVVNKKFDVLRVNPADRIIPLKKIVSPPPPPPPPPPVKGCESIGSGGEGKTKTAHDLEGCETFTITWDMRSIPDEMIIYCGKGPFKRKLWKTSGAVSGKGSRTLRCSRKFITVVIIGRQSGTSWNYDLKCDCN